MDKILNSAQDFAASLRKPKATPTAPDAMKVDPDFQEDPVAAKIVEFCLKRGANLLVYGPTGSGKSSLVINIMARMNYQAEIFSCDGETSTDALIAKPWITVANNQSVMSVAHGAALRAYKEGKKLLLEEVDHANPDILSSLHRIMEPNQSYYICNVGPQEIVSRHAAFSVIATANTIGCGEDTFQFAGTKPLNQAFMNRFAFTVRLGYLDKASEIKVIRAKTGVDNRTATMLVEAANATRDAADPTRINGAPGSQQIAATISTRDLLNWAKAVVELGFKPREAAEYAFLLRINEADRDVIRGFVQNACP